MKLFLQGCLLKRVSAEDISQSLETIAKLLHQRIYSSVIPGWELFPTGYLCLSAD